MASFVHQGISVSFGDDLRAFEREWRSFQAEADGMVFQSFEWLATWQRHVGSRQGAKPLIALGRDNKRKLLFLLPLALQRSEFGRELVWLGMELCDYTGPLLAPDFSARVSRETIAAIWQVGLTMRGRYYHVLASYTDEPNIVRHGPGAAHLMDITNRAIECGCRCSISPSGTSRTSAIHTRSGRRSTTISRRAH